MQAPRILAVASAIDLDFRYGCTPAWWQLWKGMYEAGVDLVVTPYRGRPVGRPGGEWRRTRRTARASRTRWSATCSRARATATSAVTSRTPRSGLDRLTRETIRRWITPRWKRHLIRLVENEKPDAVVVFTVPMAHLRGIPEALRARFGIPVVFYDGDVPMSLPEYGGMDTGFNPYHGADPWEYDLVLSNSEGGIPRLLELGARSRRALLGPDPEFFSPQPVEKDVDVFFYGYGDKFRRDWMKTMVGEPSRIALGARFRARRARLPGRCRYRAHPRRCAVQPLREGDLGCPVNLNITRRPHATVSGSSTARPFELASSGPRSSRTRTKASSDGSMPAASSCSSRAPKRPSRPTGSSSPIPRKPRMGRRARERARRRTYAHRARACSSSWARGRGASMT